MTDEQLGFATCGLCAETGPMPSAIRRLLVEWTDEAAKAMGRPRYGSIDRCVDRIACRTRVEQVLGEPWPVNDRTPAPEGRGVGSSDGAAGLGPRRSLVSGETGSNVPAVEPLSAPEPPAPDVEEEIAWLR